jgi:hypothetical protein
MSTFEPGSKNRYCLVFVNNGSHTIRISYEEVTYMRKFLKVKEPFNDNSLKYDASENNSISHRTA